jgi:hypothetical protein
MTNGFLQLESTIDWPLLINILQFIKFTSYYSLSLVPIGKFNKKYCKDTSSKKFLLFKKKYINKPNIILLKSD